MENYSNRSLDDSTANLLEQGVFEGLKTSIKGKLLRDSPLLASCCIFKVPQLIRRQKEQSYVPDVVSIGPYHRSPGGKFELIENVKRWYLNCFLSRDGSPMELESLIEGIMQFEKRARDCYAEPLDHLNQKDFLEMLILDGCFLIELFQKYSDGDLENGDFRVDVQNEDSRVDPIFNMDCMLDYLYHDLLLLENQLPWFVLEFLYTVKTGKTSLSLIELVLDFFKQSVPIFDRALELPGEVFHILDLIRTVIVVKFKDPESKKKDEGNDQQQQETEPDIVMKFKDPESQKKDEGKDQQQQKTEPDILLQRIPNATTLLEAGVEFKKSVDTTKCILKIEFKNGVLSIPTLGIDERTGPLFRNLIAFEQCHHARLHKITSYAVLMDSLIDTSRDIDILCERGILSNWLSAEDASKFFNDLYNDTAVVGFCYKRLCHDVNKHYNTDWNKWIAKLRHDYFSTPWAVISFIAAFILLVLTLVQTAYTIHPGPW